MKRIVNVLAIALFLAGGSQVVSAQCEDSDDHAKILAVKFHADYCGSCKALTPSIKELETKLDGEAVEFVVFDFTSDESKKKSEELAEELGVEDLYKKNQATGFVLLVNTESKEQVGKLTRKQSSEEMYETIKNLL